MSAPTNPTRDLTGKNIRSWFVVAYAGQRDGVHYWRCMCRASLAEKVVAEPDILDRKVNALSSILLSLAGSVGKSEWLDLWGVDSAWAGERARS